MNDLDAPSTLSPLPLRLHRLPPIGTKGRLCHIHTCWEELAVAAGYSAPALAQLCNVSVRHLQRHFRDCYQLKLQRWLNNVRLCHAYSMLLESPNVKVVAGELGFKHLSQFSREFKCCFGISPSLLQSRRKRVNDACSLRSA